MASLNFRNSLLILLSLTCVTISTAQEKIQPLKAGTLVALVAGDALSENVVHEIATRGLAFRPSDEFRFQLTVAGADGRVLEALRNAKISGSATEAMDKAAAERLNHLAKAGKLIRDKQFQEAAAELTGRAVGDEAIVSIQRSASRRNPSAARVITTDQFPTGCLSHTRARRRAFHPAERGEPWRPGQT